MSESSKRIEANVDILQVAQGVYDQLVNSGSDFNKLRAEGVQLLYEAITADIKKQNGNPEVIDAEASSTASSAPSSETSENSSSTTPPEGN